MTGQPNRLDSWKEIAEYLGRDVRTAMRWSKSHDLPVRRVAGGKGRSVFAFTDEIDAWLAGRNHESAVQPAPAVPEAAAAQTPQPPVITNRPWPYRLAVVASAAVVTVAAAGMTLMSLASSSPVSVRDFTVAVSAESGVTLAHRNGAPRTIFRFAPDTLAPLTETTPAIATSIDGRGTPTVLVGVGYLQNKVSKIPESGQLLHLDIDGNVLWRAPLSYSLRFPNDTFDGAFVLADWRVSPETNGPRRIAIAAHEWMWWASPIAVLDHQGRSGPAFVNPGWMESLRWLDEDRILAGGFNNLHDAAVVTLLDSRRMHGQAPGTRGTPYECLTCGPDQPLFYATLPRSELNRTTGSRFNRAQVEVLSDRITVTTIEIPAIAEPATAVYEFSRDMKLLRARYSVSYWDWHRRLEAEQRLTHSRENCPEKNGPPSIHVWNQATNSFVTHLQ